jgi:hypothetical protein
VLVIIRFAPSLALEVGGKGVDTVLLVGKLELRFVHVATDLAVHGHRLGVMKILV